jgi:hypothetical protein
MTEQTEIKEQTEIFSGFSVSTLSIFETCAANKGLTALPMSPSQKSQY